jgi:LCCL domain
MIALRLLPLCLLIALALPPVAVADDELPPDAKRLIEEHEKSSDEILKKAEETLKKAQEAQKKAQEEIEAQKAKLVTQLEDLAKNLEKIGKAAQAKAVAEQAEEIKTGRIAGAQPDPGNVGALRGQNGKVFLFEVTGANGGTVWGTDIYTDDSSLAAACVHAGLLQVGQKGAIKVTILPGENAYQGSTRNGVATHNWNAWGGSFKVEVGKRIRGGVKPGGGALADPGTLQNFRGQIGKEFLIQVTGSTNGVVWGTDIYTDDSSLATAAVHAGVLKDGEKGVVKVTILAGQQQYTDSTRNGVTTSSYAEWGGSYKIEAVKK